MTDDAREARPARKKSPGRPRISPLVRRVVGMRIWASYAERDAIHAKARAAHLPVGEYVRAAALDHPIRTVSIPQVTVEARRELASIGAHLNRLVRVSEASSTVLPDDLWRAVTSLIAQVDGLAVAMSTPPRSDYEAAP